MQILIVKLGSIGDVIHTLPALAVMRRGFPHATISWVVERRAAEILRDNPFLDRLIEVDTKALRRGLMSGETLRAPRQQLRRLRASSFDVALDFQGLIKSATMSRLSGARRVVGFSRNALREPSSRFLLTSSVLVPDRLHVIHKNLSLVQGALGLSVPGDSEELEFPIAVSTADELEAEKAAAVAAGKFAILNPGGGWSTKLWSAQRFGEFADQLWSHHGLYSLVIAGPGEGGLVESVLQASRSGRVFAASLSLKPFFALARQAQLYVGGDTGPTHIAIAAGTPVVGLFGPTEWWRNGSLRRDDICIERTDIACRVNCHRRACSKWICMDIEVATVLEAATQRLARAKHAMKNGGVGLSDFEHLQHRANPSLSISSSRG